MFGNMSRIGKKPIILPSGVSVKLDGGFVAVSGPRGELKKKIDISKVSIGVNSSMVEIKPADESQEAKVMWGTAAAHLKNMIKGVSDCYTKALEIEGIGYRAELKDGRLVLSLGFSHPVLVEPFDGVAFQVNKNVITVSGIDKERVGEMASRIKSLKKPEPYKGKGIRYQGELVLRKAGKKAAAAAS